MTFADRFSAHFYHRSNWWWLAILVWAVIQWNIDEGAGPYELPRDAYPPIVLLVSYFAISPALFFALAGVNPNVASRSWGYLVEATWPLYVADHVVNLTTLTVLYWLLGAPWGWGLFLPITQTVYITFYAARGYARRIGYYKFDDKRDDF